MSCVWNVELVPHAYHQKGGLCEGSQVNCDEPGVDSTALADQSVIAVLLYSAMI